MKDRSIFTIAVALVSLVTLAASMGGAWLEQEGRIVRGDISGDITITPGVSAQPWRPQPVQHRRHDSREQPRRNHPSSRRVSNDISFGRGHAIVKDGAPRTDGRFTNRAAPGERVAAGRVAGVPGTADRRVAVATSRGRAARPLRRG